MCRLNFPPQCVYLCSGVSQGHPSKYKFRVRFKLRNQYNTLFGIQVFVYTVEQHYFD